MTSPALSNMTPEDLSAVARIVSLCFARTREQAADWLSQAGPQNVRLLREDGDIAGSLLRIPMGQFFGGRSIPLVGIAAVGVPPERRGRGVAGRLMAAALKEMAEDAVPLSGLYAATQPLYRRVGYEQAGHRFEIRIPLALLDSREPSLTVRELHEDDADQVKACYLAFARRFDGPLDRGPYIWGRVRAARDVSYDGFAAVNGAGEIEGYIYLAVRRRPDGGRQEVAISDMAFSSVSGARRLLALLGEFASMADDLTMYGGPLHPALLLLSEQRFRIQLQDYWMLRITNVARALEARGYRAHVAARVVLEVRDDLLTQNSGRWALSVEGGRARVEPDNSGATGALSLGIGALAPLFSGYLSAMQLCLLGQARGEASAVAAADAIFAGTTPWMSDMY